MSAPTLVLCMAGLYSRFRDAGYTTPKFLLPVQGQPLLQRILAELLPGAPAVVLVANRRDAAHRAAILDAVREAGAEPDLHFIGDTGGQAETAAIGARRLLASDPDGPLIFHNIDTVLLGRDLAGIRGALGRSEGYIDTFTEDSPAFSYVQVGPRGDDGLSPVRAIAEKRVISAHATTGLYGFASARRYLHWFERSSQRSHGEFYISDVYQRMLQEGAPLLTDTRRSGQDTWVLGTPAQYEAHPAAGAG